MSSAKATDAAQKETADFIYWDIISSAFCRLIDHSVDAMLESLLWIEGGSGDTDGEGGRGNIAGWCQWMAHDGLFHSSHKNAAITIRKIFKKEEEQGGSNGEKASTPTAIFSRLVVNVFYKYKINMCMVPHIRNESRKQTRTIKSRHK